jgi:GDP-mannose transporter
MFYNNLLSIPILVICSLIVEDWSAENMALNFPAASRNNLMLAMFYSGLGTVFISYATAWCIRVTSSTTYSMVGSLNKLPLAISGLIFFDAPVTFGSVSAIIMGFVSGLIYTRSKIRQSADAKMSLPTSIPAKNKS